MVRLVQIVRIGDNMSDLISDLLSSHYNLCKRWKETGQKSMSLSVEILPYYKKFIKTLNDNSVKYLIFGEYAVNFYGRPSTKKYIKFWIERTPSNAKQLIAAIKNLGINDNGFLTVNTITNPVFHIELGENPSRIEIYNSVKGLQFEESYLDREIYELEGERVDFISLPDLIIAQSSTGFKKDLVDAIRLAKIYSKKNK